MGVGWSACGIGFWLWFRKLRVLGFLGVGSWGLGSSPDSDNGIVDAGRLVPRSEMKAVRYNHKFEGKPIRSKHYCHQSHIGKKICSRTPRWTVLKVAVYNLKQNAKGEMTQSVSLGY